MQNLELTVAVIGGGISGLSAAQKLANCGAAVTLFDRGRRIGGRLASRSFTSGCSFDHGVPAFSAVDPRFKKQVSVWCDRGVAVPWEPATCSLELVDQRPIFGQQESDIDKGSRFVGVPDANAIARLLAEELTIETAATVTGYQQCEDGVEVVVDNTPRVFDAAILAMPIEQAARLTDSPPSGAVEGIKSAPAHVAMFQLDQRLETPASWIEPIIDSDAVRLVRESDKPGRTSTCGDCWTMQTTDQWSATRLDRIAAEFSDELTDTFCKLLNVPRSAVFDVHVHRWTFALAKRPHAGKPLRDGSVVWTGDWVFGGDVEGAYRAGEAAAEVVAAI